MKIRDRIKELRRVKAAELLPNPKNWRTHPKSQQDALKGILAEVGFADALLARELDDGSLMLIDGHLRAETTGEQEVPVLILDVDEKESDKLLATFDPLAGMAECDSAALDALLRNVDTGNEALQQMLTDLAESSGLYLDNDKEIVEDEVPEVQAEAITKTGDLWLLGEHRLLCGDSTKEEDVKRLMNGATPFLMVTDPPYGVEYDPNWRNEMDRQNGKPYGERAVGMVTNDDKADWTETWKLFPGDVAYVWHAGSKSPTVASNLQAAGFELRNLIVWAKSNFSISRGHYHHKHEPCWYVYRHGKTSRFIGDRSQTTLWQIDKPMKNETGHSTQKPLECMAIPQRNHDSDSVYDPFLGSGTTLIAAEQLGRKCYGMEISPQYCDVIVKRWETLTGKKATLEVKS